MDDFRMELPGEVAILHAQTDRALRFIDVQLRGAMRSGQAIFLEPYQVPSTVDVIRLEGLTVSLSAPTP